MKLFPVLSLLLATAGSAQANLLTNGSFEAGTFTGGSFGFPLGQQLAPGSTTMPGWTVTTAELAWFKTGQAGIATQDLMYALDLTGFCDLGLSCGLNGVYSGVSQTLTTVAGATYSLAFQAGNYSLNTSQPSIVATAGSTTQTFALAGTGLRSGAWQPFGFNFVSTGSITVISFGGAGGTNGGTSYLGLDNVNVELVSLPVPEPHTALLMVLGMLGLAALVHKRT